MRASEIEWEDRNTIVGKAEQAFYKYFNINGKLEIDNDGSIKVDGDVKLKKHPPKGILPVRFSSVSKQFDCSSNKLISLNGSPQKCGDFICSNNLLTSLEGGPQLIDGYCNCDRNKLTSLRHAAAFSGAKSFTFFTCNDNLLSSLEGCPNNLEMLFCEDNPLSSLNGLTDDTKTIRLTANPRLPLLRLVGKIAIFSVLEPTCAILDRIFSKHKDSKTSLRANIIACQKDLIDAGLEGNASW